MSLLQLCLLDSSHIFAGSEFVPSKFQSESELLLVASAVLVADWLHALFVSLW